MSTMRIIPTLDPSEDRPTCFVSSLEVMAVQHFTLESRKDTFGHGVVETIADAAHRGSYTEQRAAPAEGNRCVLAAVIGGALR